MIERKTIAVVTVTLCLCVFALADGDHPPAVLNNAPADQTAQDTKPFDQQQVIQELTKQIAGQERKPAEEVFKNIKILKGVPAGRLLAVMQIGYSKSLGVNCTHCHVVNQWEKDDKPEKQITREM